jgi:hypothetical protein
MVAVTVSVYVGEDRKLAITLPADAPMGLVQLVVTPLETSDDDSQDLRARLIAAGVLVNPVDMDIPEDIEYLSDEELEQLPPTPPGTRSSLDLVNEDRGAY